jgi:hypothetical protein
LDLKKVAVVSHKGWDGSRVIGVYNNAAEALLAIKKFNYDKEREEIVIDVMHMCKISTSCGHVHNKEQSENSILQREHYYSQLMRREDN